MAMGTVGIRMSDEEKEWINTFAEFNGTTFSELVRSWIKERIEDELDNRELADAVANDDGARYSHEEVFSRTGANL
ncbi:MAG: DUF6290 family protein [Coriobacteriia bacterium]|nr:DUF6290 family protein [Coriobacteriia bacterium]